MATISYETTAAVQSTLSTFAFDDVDVGTPAANRVVGLAIEGTINDQPDNTITNLTVGGVDATDNVIVTAHGARGDFDTFIALAAVELPDGETADIAVTFTTAMFNCVVHAFAMYGVDLEAVLTNTASGTGPASLSVPVNVPTGGVAFGAAASYHHTSTAAPQHAWAGLTKRAEANQFSDDHAYSAGDHAATEAQEPLTAVVTFDAFDGVPDSSCAAIVSFGALDETAPVLSNPMGTATGQTTAGLSVDTDEGNGTLYWVVTQSSTSPSGAQVAAGQDHTGAAAADSGNQAVSGTGTQNVAGGASGLSAATMYWAHFVQDDAAANRSAVVTSASFTTDSPPPSSITPTDHGGGGHGRRASGLLPWWWTAYFWPPEWPPEDDESERERIARLRAEARERYAAAVARIIARRAEERRQAAEDAERQRQADEVLRARTRAVLDARETERRQEAEGVSAALQRVWGRRDDERRRQEEEERERKRRTVRNRRNPFSRRFETAIALLREQGWSKR